MRSFRVRKILPGGEVKIEYSGNLKELTKEFISIDTGWSRDTLDLGYVIFERDDVWVETFYFRRWFNVFRISTRDGILKGFYINIAEPPRVTDDCIDWTDLAMDIWVRPDGTYIVLDEDEFEKLDLDRDTVMMAEEALLEAIEFVENREGPLSELK
jgi:predicted RNA-binding protein associated with RNAse of E/G family